MLTYREALRAFADGKTLEINTGIGWVVATDFSGFNLDALDTPSPYRIQQATITINGVEVPEPLREAPKVGTPYYVPSVLLAGAGQNFWKNDSHDRDLLRRGIVHLTREAADAHACALILASGGQV